MSVASVPNRAVTKRQSTGVGRVSRVGNIS